MGKIRRINLVVCPGLEWQKAENVKLKMTGWTCGRRMR